MLNLKGKSELRTLFEDNLKARVIGQDPIMETVSGIFEKGIVNMSDPGKPLGSLLMLGPPGTGKTLTAESVAETLHGDSRCMLKVSCAEYTESHQIARLIGAPPGYIGHNDTEALINESSLTRGWKDGGPRVSVILFDEIEKANYSLHQIMLGILDKGELTNGKNVRLDMSRCLIFMTSNIGSRTIAQQSIGFSKADPKTNFEQVAKNVVAEAKQKFAAEFIDRLSGIVVYKPLSNKDKDRILDIEIRRVWWRALRALSLSNAKFENKAFTLAVTKRLRKVMLREAYEKNSARKLKAVIDKFISDSLTRVIASQQIEVPGTIILDYKHNKVVGDFRVHDPRSLILNAAIDATKDKSDEQPPSNVGF